jgi:hypothetical protein
VTCIELPPAHLRDLDVRDFSMHRPLSWQWGNGEERKLQLEGGVLASFDPNAGCSDPFNQPRVVDVSGPETKTSTSKSE